MGIDRVTGRNIEFQVDINETVQFGSVLITPRACIANNESIRPGATAFLEIAERNSDGQLDKGFSGWIFADNPGYNGFIHPTYDIWLVKCHGPPPRR